MYYQHANDMWNKKTGIQATGEITTCLNAFHDLMMENDTYRGPYKGPMGGWALPVRIQVIPSGWHGYVSQMEKDPLQDPQTCSCWDIGYLEVINDLKPLPTYC